MLRYLILLGWTCVIFNLPGVPGSPPGISDSSPVMTVHVRETWWIDHVSNGDVKFTYQTDPESSTYHETYFPKGSIAYSCTGCDSGRYGPFSCGDEQ